MKCKPPCPGFEIVLPILSYDDNCHNKHTSRNTKCKKEGLTCNPTAVYSMLSVFHWA